jgi:hypothetical protein
VYEQDKEWNVEPIQSKEQAGPPVALHRLVVPALITLGLMTFDAWVIWLAGPDPWWEAVVVGCLCGIPPAIFIFVSYVGD